MRISDWSSDVCSSDLAPGRVARLAQIADDGTHLADVRRPFQRSDEQLDGMQRLPQVVARSGQKAGLGAVRALGRLAGLLQLRDLSRYRGDAALAGPPVGPKISPAVLPGAVDMPLRRALGRDSAADRYPT